MLLKYEPHHGNSNNVVSEQIRHKSDCTAQKFEKKRKCSVRVAKTKALISFAVTAKLICAFVFAYADCWVFHEAAHISKRPVFSVRAKF